MTELQNQSAVRSARDVATAPELFETRDPQRVLRRIPSGRRCQPADQAERDHRVHRPVGLRQDHRAALLQPDERSHRRRTGRGNRQLSRCRPLRSRSQRCRGPSTHRHGLPEGEPVPEEHLRQRRVRAAPAGHKEQGRARRHRRTVAARCGAVGRGEGSVEDVGARPVGWPAAATVHRPCNRRRARCDPDGRAVLRPGSRSPPPASRT